MSTKNINSSDKKFVILKLSNWCPFLRKKKNSCPFYQKKEKKKAF
jgi:Fe-S-cluster containining protein